MKILFRGGAADGSIMEISPELHGNGMVRVDEPIEPPTTPFYGAGAPCNISIKILEYRDTGLFTRNGMPVYDLLEMVAK